jgi:hypothetical protein
MAVALDGSTCLLPKAPLEDTSVGCAGVAEAKKRACPWQAIVGEWQMAGLHTESDRRTPAHAKSRVL